MIKVGSVVTLSGARGHIYIVQKLLNDELVEVFDSSSGVIHTVGVSDVVASMVLDFDSLLDKQRAAQETRGQVNLGAEKKFENFLITVGVLERYRTGTYTLSEACRALTSKAVPVTSAQRFVLQKIFLQCAKRNEEKSSSHIHACMQVECAELGLPSPSMSTVRSMLIKSCPEHRCLTSLRPRDSGQLMSTSEHFESNTLAWNFDGRDCPIFIADVTAKDHTSIQSACGRPASDAPSVCTARKGEVDDE